MTLMCGERIGIRDKYCYTGSEKRCIWILGGKECQGGCSEQHAQRSEKPSVDGI
jgi:hypothetical protein